MSSEDSFISEVTEEVRRDRLYKLFRKYGWIAALLIVLIVAGAAFFEWRKAQAAAAAQASGDAILAALEEADPDARAEALASLSADGNSARSALIAFMAADSAIDTGDRDGALAGLLSVADNADVPAAYRELAAVKWAIIGAGETSPDDRISRMNSIALGASAFRLLAMEQIALAEAEQGNVDAALGTLNDIVNDAGVTQDLRVRATQLIVALGGDPAGG